MGLSFVQADTAATFGAVQSCSNVGLATVTKARMAVQAGTPGVTSSIVTLAGSANVSGVMFQLHPGVASWQAGTWVVPLNVGTANANVTYRRLFVCRRTAADVAVATVVNSGVVQVVLNPAGIYTGTVTGVASSGAIDDVAYIVCTVLNGAGTAQSFQFTPNQTILTPIERVLVNGQSYIETGIYLGDI